MSKELIDIMQDKKKETERKLDNVIWHIETNRQVLGDKRTLDDVFQALKNWTEESKSSQY
ncbi:hypothetical protein [Clostridium beijerinckii]|uniref:hypothetical protein n=1 Tax=Clostridium beijerinckii TaxID=1520 RepID=UPI00055D9827|nr:hypothetical protein [Clostridium beijerinckii]